MTKRLSGSLHPMWNGGKSVNTQGYVLIYSPDHPFKDDRNCVREHRLVMEKHVGRYLDPGEIVHHINGKRDDNRIENLELLYKSEHDSLHAKINGQIAVSRRIKKKCPWCGKTFSVPKSLMRIKCCSISCSKHCQWEKGGVAAFGRDER